MQKFLFLVFLFSSIILSNCVMPSSDRNEKMVDNASDIKRDSFELLCQYWKLTDADNPTSHDIAFTNNDGVAYESGIVFMSDSSFLENPTGELAYGRFKLKGDSIEAHFDDGRKAIYTITVLHKDELILNRTENKHKSKLTYKGTNTSWPEANKNPFSKENYQWATKPKKPETDAEIKLRVKESVQFYIYYFNGFVNGGADNIDFTGLPGCLNWYQGGITIQSENKLDKKWISCFYSKQQAYKGRQILQDAITKKYNWNEKETNWLKQTVDVLEQIHDKM